jgi:hypothetical protein
MNELTFTEKVERLAALIILEDILDELELDDPMPLSHEEVNEYLYARGYTEAGLRVWAEKLNKMILCFDFLYHQKEDDMRTYVMGYLRFEEKHHD